MLYQYLNIAFFAYSNSLNWPARLQAGIFGISGMSELGFMGFMGLLGLSELGFVGFEGSLGMKKYFVQFLTRNSNST